MQQTQFPNKIKILDQIFKITYIEKLSEMSEDGEGTFYGQTDFHHRKMRIYKPKDYSPAEVWNTIIHEATHVIVETMKILEGENSVDDKCKERIIHLIATGINTVMIDNNLYFQKIDS